MLEILSACMKTIFDVVYSDIPSYLVHGPFIHSFSVFLSLCFKVNVTLYFSCMFSKLEQLGHYSSSEYCCCILCITKFLKRLITFDLSIINEKWKKEGEMSKNVSTILVLTFATAKPKFIFINTKKIFFFKVLCLLPR